MEPSANSRNTSAEQLEVWEGIAPGWYRLRRHSRFRGELEDLARRWQGGVLLNIGCAHGPDFLPFVDGFELWGVDFSINMLRLAREYSAKYGLKVRLVRGEATALPFRDEAFDYAIAIAVYHHIKRGRQEQALRELWRILKPGGEAFLTVWNKWQPRFWLRPKELTIPWHQGDKVYQRYYYLFSRWELSHLLQKCGFRVLFCAPEKTYRFPLNFFSRNICLLVRKETPALELSIARMARQGRTCFLPKEAVL